MGGSLLHGLPLVALSNILINQKTGLGPWGRWAVVFEIINKKHILFFGLLKTFFERVHLSERLQTFRKVANFQKGCILIYKYSFKESFN